jgi:pyruvate, orthophosphate dikinase
MALASWVYSYGGGKADGSAADLALLGGKGANLAEMSRLGLPVPPGFTITTDACAAFFTNGRALPEDLKPSVQGALETLGKQTGRRFGDPENPLLVSVRSGSRASMPGMMDTVLNLGLNDLTTEGLAARTGDPRFAWDSYRRFIQMYSDVVLGLDNSVFEDIIDAYVAKRGLNSTTELDAEALKSLSAKFKKTVEDELGEAFPQDPEVQLWAAIRAVFASWKNVRAVTYRRLHDIPDDWGTAVTVQSMVFGNRGAGSATGVAFTRDPSTGEKGLYGEYLPNAQGEDVVAGNRTPQSLTEKGRKAIGSQEHSLEIAMPAAFGELLEVAGNLERHFKDVQDIEFTIENGKLWMLQTRTGKRTLKAAIRIAVELEGEGIISREDALMRIDPSALDQILHPTIDPSAERVVVGSGLPASPGAATGEIVFSSEEAERLKLDGRKSILVRAETSPEDVHGMHAAEGVLTTRGGMTSHAAVVARGMGKPCVTGAGNLKVDLKSGVLIGAGMRLKRGDIITIDGGLGQVLKGAVPMIQPQLSGEFATIMEWADQARRMKVRANADTPADARVARMFGAEGIGLCRTEQMFFEEDRISAMREMIIAETEAERRNALARLLPIQKANFVQLFEMMPGLPVTIRLLDPPLHEFLPKDFAEVVEVAAAMGLPVEKLRDRIDALHEFNPMLGHRGCRLVISYPEIAEMQSRAIFEAAVEAGRRTGTEVVPEIMVPLVSMMKELEFIKARIAEVARQVERETGTTLKYLVGTMIELPRAAMRAGAIAEASEFFSFGTNDLTQTTFGISRDDASAFMNTYMQKGLMARDPFMTLDREGVGEIIRIACERGRATRPDIALGVCGEHGGEPESIRFFEETGLDFISCSPYRVPIARLAAAQAAIANKVTPKTIS